MPRFDNEGFNPNKRIDNDSRDRSVPTEENYYGNNIDINSFSDADVIDHQDSTDINTYLNNFDNKFEAPNRNRTQFNSGYDADMLRNFDSQRRMQNTRPPKEKKRSGKNARPHKRRKKGISVIAVLLILVLLVSGLLNVALARISYDEKMDNQYVTSSELHSNAMVKNILLLGVDARPDDEAETSRADSMMLVSVDMKHRCIKMVSFLRDTWVYIPAHDGSQRLNAACTYGGYSGVVDTIEYNFGVDIDGYVVADFEMFKVLVDSIGGVEVDVTKKEAKEVTKHPKRYGNVTLESGKYKLTGEQALAYCRIRKIDTDFVRTKRQRTVMQSILKEVKHSNPFTLYKMAYNSTPYIQTNLKKSELKKIAASAGICLGDMVQTKVPFEHTWEYANKNGASVIAINVEKNKEQLIDFIYNKTAAEIEAEQEE